MTSTLGVGVPVPKMLPITGTWTLPFAAYLLILSNRVAVRRVQNDKYIGDRMTEGPTSADNPDPLQLDSRAHGNFLEYVPLAFAFTAIAELNGANRKALNYAMAGLFVLRILHVELGLKGKGANGIGRPVGYFGTQGFLAGMAAYGTYLVKGYWGY
ncbi:MAG: hypothetical protein Q9217_005869 [Psora testacea]